MNNSSNLCVYIYVCVCVFWGGGLQRCSNHPWTKCHMIDSSTLDTGRTVSIRARQAEITETRAMRNDQLSVRPKSVMAVCLREKHNYPFCFFLLLFQMNLSTNPSFREKRCVYVFLYPGAVLDSSTNFAKGSGSYSGRSNSIKGNGSGNGIGIGLIIGCVVVVAVIGVLVALNQQVECYENFAIMKMWWNLTSTDVYSLAVDVRSLPFSFLVLLI